MAYKSDNPLFRDLTDEEVEKFRQWARDNNPPDTSAWEVYHPVCREVWIERGLGPKSAEPAEGCIPMPEPPPRHTDDAAPDRPDVDDATHEYRAHKLKVEAGHYAFAMDCGLRTPVQTVQDVLDTHNPRRAMGILMLIAQRTIKRNAYETAVMRVALGD